MNMALQFDRELLRAQARSTRYLAITLNAPAAPPRDPAAIRTPLHVGLVLDRSGSMDIEDRFILARDATARALMMLHPEDHFTLVVYDSTIDILAPATPATTSAIHAAIAALQTIAPRGSTDLHGGWMAAATQLQQTRQPDALHRILLLTDGHANAGETSRAALGDLSTSLKSTGIATTTFGVGGDFDEELLSAIALAGGGSCYYMQSGPQIEDLLTSELGEALDIVCRDILVQLALPPGASATLLNHYRTTQVDGDNELHLHVGDLSAHQAVTLLVAITFPEGPVGTSTSVRVALSASDGISNVMEQEISWRYADHAANNAQPRNVAVDREVATQYAALARRDAVAANRHHDFETARERLGATARRIRGYANGDPILEALWRELETEQQDYSSRALNPLELKANFFNAEFSRRSRLPDGKSRRREP